LFGGRPLKPKSYEGKEKEKWHEGKCIIFVAEEIKKKKK
jgi:hypothetical protein